MARPAVAFKILRGRNQQTPQRYDRLANDVFAADIARLNADVVALLDRIVNAIVMMQLNGQLGVLLLKPANIAAEMMREKGRDAAQAQGSAKSHRQRSHRRLRLV